MSARAQDGRCPFCVRMERGEFDRSWRWPNAVAFEPLNPVAPGHRLVVPHLHVSDAVAHPMVTAETMRCAALLAAGLGDCNIITSIGAAATQTVPHLHVHVVPRRLGDGLALPWTEQEAS